MSDETPQRSITVSRDALRADLLELELRLKAYFDVQLAQKASAETVHDLVIASERWARGEFTDAQLRSIDERLMHTLDEKAGRTWTGRERLFAVLSVVTSVAMLVLSIVLAAHGIGGVL